MEFALVLPLLVLLIAGIAEFGRLYYLQTTISGAAREGVRTMALQNSAPTAQDAARTAAGPLALSNAQIVVTPPSGSCKSTATTTVTATVTITYSTTLMSGFFGAGKSLTGRGVMRCGG